MFLRMQNTHDSHGFDTARWRGSTMPPDGKLLPTVTKVIKPKVSYTPLSIFAS